MQIGPQLDNVWSAPIFRKLPPLTPRRAVCFVVVLSFLLHLLYLYENDWGMGLVSAYLQSDAYYYFHKAWFSAFISSEGGMLSTVVPFSPYISLVTIGFSLFGAHLWVPFLVSAICVSISSGLIVLLTTRLFTLRIGFLAGLLSAFCGVLIFYSGLTVKSGVELLGVSMAIYLGVLAIQKQSYKAYIAAIAVVAVTAYDRDNLVIILLPLAVIFIRSMSNQGKIYRHVFFSLTSLVIVWLLIKLIVDLTWGFSGTNLIGVNFYMGNAPGATGGYTPLHGFSNNLIGLRLETYQSLVDEHGGPPSFWQMHTFMMRECFDYYIDRPLDYLYLKTKHFLLLFSQYGYGHPEQYAFWRYEYVSTTLAFVDWRLILALCIVFFICNGSSILKNKSICFIFFSGVFYAVTVWIFLVTERYRLVLFIIFIPFAGAGLYELVRRPDTKKAGIFLSAFMLSTLSNSFLNEGQGWSKDKNSAQLLERENRTANMAIYNAMGKIANENDYKSFVYFTEALIRQNNCHDAMLIAAKAKEIHPTSRIDRMISLCAAGSHPK